MARKKKLDPALEKRLEDLKSIVRNSNLPQYRKAAKILSDPEQYELMKVFFNEHSGITREVWYEMVPFFQQHLALWERLREEVPYHIHSRVDEWLPREILEFSGSKRQFCNFATKTVRKTYPDFPDLKLGILTNKSTGYYYSCETGTAMSGDRGWRLMIEGALFGPAETRERETWEAEAIHPESNLKVTMFYESSPAYHVWLEQVPSSKM